MFMWLIYAVTVGHQAHVAFLSLLCAAMHGDLLPVAKLVNAFAQENNTTSRSAPLSFLLPSPPPLLMSLLLPCVSIGRFESPCAVPPVHQLCCDFWLCFVFGFPAKLWLARELSVFG